jgi:hypothetical protein
VVARLSPETIITLAQWEFVACAALAGSATTMAVGFHETGQPWRLAANVAVGFAQAASLWWTLGRHVRLTRGEAPNWTAAPTQPAAEEPAKPATRWRPWRSLMTSAPGMADTMPRAVTVTDSGGAPRSTPDDVMELASKNDVLEANSKPILYLEQLGVRAQRTGILLTTHQIIIVTLHMSNDPEIAVWDNPKEFTVTGDLDGTRVIIASPVHGAIVDEDGFSIAAAARLHDLLGAVRFGILDPEHDVPPEITFDGILPIEVYEATLGPNIGPQDRKVIQTRRHDVHRFELVYQSTESHGYLVPKWFIERDGGDVEVPGFFSPMRTNKTALTRSAKRPFHLNVKGHGDARALLEKDGFAYDPAQNQIRRRYPRAKPASGLEMMLRALHGTGVKPGPRGYQLRRGETFDHLTYNGKTFSFTKDGRPIQLVHPGEPSPVEPLNPPNR